MSNVLAEAITPDHPRDRIVGVYAYHRDEAGSRFATVRLADGSKAEIDLLDIFISHTIRAVAAAA
ncbi:hypothetical protein CJ179_50415 [Rhodococcus sp. ACS1]|uniref:hypothetical protein n=1 Tax=Rhodococcus sp. ACS1 TaxID=2028570 RepID=UPI000BB0EB70|nr:hypothetical protein [Rhodococcus sp. ACS1]PBC35005.1 hypothetical protein CJ179_50415 [Rhodococcus sp. ACS1]